VARHAARFGLRQKIAGQVVAHADDELTTPFLRHTQFPGVLNLAMHTIAERAALLLNPGEILAAGGRAQTEDVLHHEDLRLKELHITQELTIEVAPGISFEARPAVGAVTLAHSGEALAGRAANDDIHLVSAGEGGDLLGRERGEIAFERVLDRQQAGVALLHEVGAERGNGLGVRVNGRKYAEPGPLHTQGEPAAATEEIEARQLASRRLSRAPLISRRSRRGERWRPIAIRRFVVRHGLLARNQRWVVPRLAHTSTPLHRSPTLTPNARAMRSTVLMPGLRTPRSIPLT